MKSKKRKILLGLLVVFVLGGAYGLPKIWRLAGRVTAPHRYEMNGEVLNFFEPDNQHGVVTEWAELPGGKVHYLVVRSAGTEHLSGKGKEFRELTAGLLAEPVDFEVVQGIVVLLHGHGGRCDTLLPVAELFCSVGLVCVIPDLPGHGRTGIERCAYGVTEFEKSLPGQLVDEVKGKLGKNPPCFLWGASMGGSYALHSLAADQDRWGSAVVVSTFDTLEGVLMDESQNALGWAAPVLRVVATPFIHAQAEFKIADVRPVDRAAEITTPVMVVHGEVDQRIPLTRGKRVFEALVGVKEWITIAGGHHDNVLNSELSIFAREAVWFLRLPEKKAVEVKPSEENSIGAGVSAQKAPLLRYEILQTLALANDFSDSLRLRP